MKAVEPEGVGVVDVQVAPAFAAAVEADALVAAVRATLEAEGRWPAAVTLVITDDEGIRDLNHTFAGTDAPTDVLSFSAWEGMPDFVVGDPDESAYLGDVVISYPFAAAQATARNLPVRRELALLAIHGTLHLLGYDHAEPEDEARMWARQDGMLHSLGYSAGPTLGDKA
jgi:probable rRNA maturation factor